MLAKKEDAAMSLRSMLLPVVFAVFAPAAPAQFKFTRGQTLHYKVDQTTQVTNIERDTKTVLASRTELVKRWEVLDVDPQGVATLRMTITSLRFVQRLPNGETLSFDSTHPEASPKALRDQMSGFVGKASVQLRIDAAGKILDAKPLVPAPTRHYESEPPFVLTFSGTPIEAGKTWSRAYVIALDPPLGAGEKFDAEQHFEVKNVTPNQAVIAFRASLKNPPQEPAEAIPLLQKQPTGEAVFDTTRGLLLSARSTCGGAVEGHAGAGSRYEYTSFYQEILLPE